MPTILILQKIHMLWGIMLALFLMSVYMYNQHVTSVFLRLTYLFVAGTGVWMLVKMNFSFLFLLKGILAVVLIGVMEMLLAKTKRRERTLPLWVLFIILMIIVPTMGYLLV